MNFIDFISVKAQSCGWRISRVYSDSLVSITFNTDSGTETCFIRPCGKNSDGNTILEFSSARIPIPDDKGVAGDFALALLKRNGELMLGHWGIEELNGEKTFTVFASMIANTMDVEEFRAAVTAVISERERLFKAFQRSAIDF